MKPQTKKKSLIESVSNTSIGLITSFLIQITLYPALGIPVTLSQNIFITFVFFMASIIRSYIVRRFFNKLN
jgi:hypothetical protein